MRDTIAALLVFALAFIIIFIGFSILFLVYLAVVPGGIGLVFDNPYSMALYPALGLGMLWALARAAKKPGKILLTLGGLGLGMALLLFLGLPATAWLPSPLAPDRIPYAAKQIHDLRETQPDGTQKRQVFWFHDVSLGQFLSHLYTWESPRKSQGPGEIFYSPSGQYDSAHKRILLEGTTQTLGLTGFSAEADYFSHQGPFQAVVQEMKTTYQALADQWKASPAVAWIWCLLLAGTWVGLFFLFSLKPWPLLQWIFLLLFARVLFWLYPFSVTEGPQILKTYFPGWASIFPYYFYLLIILSFFSLIWVMKPHRREVVRD